MSKKSSRLPAGAKPPKPPGPPTVENPGDESELPDEVKNPPAGKSAADRFNDWEEGRILQVLKTEFGGTGFVTLQRRHMSIAQGQWTNMAANIPIENLATGGINLIASMFGGGDYRAKARPSNGQFAREFSFSIDHSIPPKNPMNQGADKKEPAALDLPAIMREMRESAPKPDNSVLLAMMTQQTAIMQAAIARPEPKPDPAASAVLEGMVKLMDRMTSRMERIEEKLNQPTKAPTLREQLEDAKELFEMIGGNGGHEKAEPFWKDLGRGLGEAVVPILKQHFAGGAPASSVAPLIASTTAVTAPPASAQPAAAANGTAETPPETTTEPMNLPLQYALNQFRKQAVDAARKGKNAFEWIDSVIGLVPENMHVAVYKLANDPDWFSKIFGADPEALKHTKFMTEVREAILCRAFVAHAQQFAAVKKPAAETAQAFMGWVSQDFLQCLYDSTDTEEWLMMFEESSLDPAWLEQLRKTIDTELGGEAAVVTPMPSDGEKK